MNVVSKEILTVRGLCRGLTPYLRFRNWRAVNSWRREDEVIAAIHLFINSGIVGIHSTMELRGFFEPAF